MPTLAASPPGTVLDGEIVAGDGKKGSFSELHRKYTPGGAPVSYVVFDVLRLGGRWLLDESLEKRRALLSQTGDLVFSPGLFGEGKRCFAALRSEGYEGIVGKKLSSKYYPGKRTREWLKIKAFETAEGLVESFLLKRGIPETMSVRGKAGEFLQEVALPRGLVQGEVWENLLGRMATSRTGSRVVVPPVLGATIRYLEKTAGGHLRHATVVGFFPVDAETVAATRQLAGWSKAGRRSEDADED
jgi:ATP-dependent DNA ligase